MRNFDPNTTGLYRDTTKKRTSPVNGTITRACHDCKQSKTLVGGQQFKDGHRFKWRCAACKAGVKNGAR